MPIIITFSKSNGDQVETHEFGDDVAKQDHNIDRLTEWARSVYFNDDGSKPGPAAGRSRLAKHTVQAWRDQMKLYEHKQDVNALPPPEDIDV